MNSKKILLPVFVVIALVQLYVPAKMILDREKILSAGEEFKFRTAPIDPSDPFRGKYIVLNFEDNIVAVANEADWAIGESVYALLSTDSDGFAKVEGVAKERPADSEAYLRTKVNYVTGNGEDELTLDFPFDRFYMEESKAYEAELSYRESQLDTTQVAYAVVSIKDGEAVLKDVLIDGTPIKEIVEAAREE